MVFTRAPVRSTSPNRVLSAFGTSVPVPHPEDTGIDFYCTLTERIDQLIWAKASYSVQVKSEGVWVLEGRESVDWLIKHPLPLFLGAMDKNTLTFRIYHTAPRFYPWGLGDFPDRLELTMTHETVGQSTQWIGEYKFSLVPILCIEMAQLASDTDYAQNARDVLEYWIAVENRNLARMMVDLRGWEMPDKYETNVLPKSGRVSQWLSRPSPELMNNSVRSLAQQLEILGRQFHDTGNYIAAVEAAHRRIRGLSAESSTPSCRELSSSKPKSMNSSRLAALTTTFIPASWAGGKCRLLPVSGPQWIKLMQKTTVTELRPVLETQLPIWKFRFAGLIEPVVPSPSFAIRVKPDRKRSLRDLQAQGILTKKDDPRNRRAVQEDFIARLQGLDHIEVIQEAIRARKNMLIVGGTGAGKTTIANAILEEIGTLTPGDRVLVIEDTQELLLDSANSLSMLATTEFDQLKCLKVALRLKPDRIIVGEVRDGAAALPLLKAWNTGHPGGVSTIHANSAAEALVRLEDLVREATEAPQQRTIGAAVDVVISVVNDPVEGRKVQEVAVVTGYQDGRYLLTQV